MKTILRILLYGLLAVAIRLLLKVEVRGREHVPASGPYIAIGNHFSWFEIPLLFHYLPQSPAVFGAREMVDLPPLRFLAWLFPVIPVWRGQVDRQALRQALQVLQDGGILGIFPEGGIDPELQDAISRGHQFARTEGQNSRHPAVLIKAHAGPAYLAVESGAPILPVAYMGTEHVLNNLRRLRRTPVTVCFGPLFGPLTLPASVRGVGRRQALDDFADGMMREVAALMPPAYHGVYAIPHPPPN